MSARTAIDVSGLPAVAFGHRSLMWWGTMGLVAIESTMFVLALVSYYYLRLTVQDWPPQQPDPRLLWGTVNTLVLLASAWPNQVAKSVAEKFDLRGVQIWLTICIAFGVVFTAIRWFELMSLNTWWYDNAYGSIVWTVMGLHTAHLVTDLIDTVVLWVLMFTDRVTPTRFVDVSENAFYWYFVVLSWLPIYVTIYWAPRWL